MRLCSVTGCERKHRAHGLCNMHLYRQQYRGSTDASDLSRAQPGTWHKRKGYHHIGTVPVHISVVESVLGRKLPFGAVIHHVNEIKDDNRNGNLVVCPDHAYHMLIHQRMRALASCGNANWLKCKFCKQYDSPNALVTPLRKRDGAYHQRCHTNYEYQRRHKVAI